MALSDTFNRRVRRRDIKSSALAQEGLGSIAARVTGVTLLTTTVSNGDDFVVTATITSLKEFDLIGAEPYFAFYEGSVAAANQIFEGSAITSSNWVMSYMGYDLARWNGTKWQTKVSYYLRNVAAGADTTVVIRVAWKYLSRE